MTPAELRAIDALVAEKVMGLGEIEHDYPCGIHPDCCEYEAPDTREQASRWDDDVRPIWREHHDNGWVQIHVVSFYSTSIAAAWQVVERLLARRMYPDLISTQSQWKCIVDKYIELDEIDDNDINWPIEAEADTAPLAICLAALRVVGVEIPEATP